MPIFAMPCRSMLYTGGTLSHCSFGRTFRRQIYKNMAKYLLFEVKSASDRKRFLDMVDDIYAGCDNYIRPWDHDIEAVFDPARNNLFEDGEAIRWLVGDQEGRIVGRIAAFYNRKEATKTIEQPTGGCGFFECIDSAEVAAMLFDAAREWLASKGLEAMDGPINFGPRDTWWGVLYDGFFPPIYGMNYNHPYYPRLFEDYGFKNYFNQYSCSRDLMGDDMNDALFAKAERIAKNPEYLFRSVRKNELDRVAEDFRNIYNKAWAGFNGVSPLTREQAKKIMDTLRPIVDPRLIIFAFHNGEPIGFFINLPDINGAIRHLHGKFNLWAKLKFLYHLKIRKSCRIVMSMIFGVLPEYQGKGIESAMINKFKEVAAQIRGNYDSLELVWVGDFNPLMIRMIETYVMAKKHKTHVTYRYLFDRTKPFTRCPRVSKSRKGSEADPKNS